MNYILVPLLALAGVAASCGGDDESTTTTASTSTASTSTTEETTTASLNATAFQFSNVDRARYLFAGSCVDFGGFIQADVCEFERNG